METVKNILSILGMIGMPSLGCILGWLIKKVQTDKKIREQEIESREKEIVVLKKGVQAMLRSQMITEYNKWHEDRCYAPIWVKDNFENIWIQYETLGENGVMNKIHDKFMSLPTEFSNKNK
jgi:hypothetical protein